MSKVRGISFSGSIKYIRKNFGEEGFCKVLENLPENAREIISGTLNIMEWYPQEAFAIFLSVADEVLGNGDRSVCYEAGKANAEGAFGGIYKVFLEFGRPQTVLRKAALAWRVLNDTGYLEVEIIRENYAKGKIKEYENPHKCLCRHLAGYFEKVLELSGGNDVKVTETKCRCQGDDCCEYEVV